MTSIADLQTYLKQTGRYSGAVDGVWGRLTEAGTLLGLSDGPDTALTDADYARSATRLQVPPAYIKAFASVEAGGAGFADGKPKILPERHVFSKLTKGQFDKSNPTLSYPKWGTLPYPSSQDARYDLLLAMIHLDVDAGFGACSYGKFQILGSNYAACGFSSAMSFAFGMARDEATQLMAFEGFIRVNGILSPLRAGDWVKVASMYNGPAFRANNYDTKLAAAAKSFGG